MRFIIIEVLHNSKKSCQLLGCSLGCHTANPYSDACSMMIMREVESFVSVGAILISSLVFCCIMPTSLCYYIHFILLSTNTNIYFLYCYYVHDIQIPNYRPQFTRRTTKVSVKLSCYLEAALMSIQEDSLSPPKHYAHGYLFP
jgi:hypothetical protein